MSKVARRLAEIPAGSWTKWVVMGFWVAVIVVAFPLAGKLTHAYKNNASSWLPANAESVKVFNVQSRFQSPNTYPGVVVYYRDSGITPADRAKAAADARRLFFAPLLMILFWRKYPRWWFDWNLELQRFINRVGVYLSLMDDRYPATDDHQSMHLDYS
jgi:hypothetical protein